MMGRDEFLRVMGRVYDASLIVEEGKDNRSVETATAEIIGELGEALSGAGVMNIFHKWFRKRAVGESDAKLDTEHDAALTDREIYTGAGYLLALLRAIMPGEIGLSVASDLTMLGAGVRPPRIARLVAGTGSTLATDAGTICTITGICGAAYYLAGRNGVQDWLPAHREIFPGDKDDLPDERTRREWASIVKPETLEFFRKAGELRRQIGEDGDLPQEFAIVEGWARTTINNPPSDNVALLEFVKRQKKELRRR